MSSQQELSSAARHSLSSASLLLKSSLPYGKLSGKRHGAYFLLECGDKLCATFVTTSAAAIMFHRFFREASEQQYDVYLVAAACLYLAGKLHQRPALQLRDVVNVAATTAAAGALPDTVQQPPDMTGSYVKLRESVANAELLVLRMIKFRVEEQPLPHKFLLMYLDAVESWTGMAKFRAVPISRTAWTLLNDCLVGEFVANTKSQHLALACLHVAFQSYGFVIPCSTGAAIPWHQVLCDSCSVEVLWRVTEQLLDVYEQDTQLQRALTR